jgi:hypothetical protein
MQESYRNGAASHSDPESCVGNRRKAAIEALTGAHAGRVLSCDIRHHQGADGVRMPEGNILRDAKASCEGALRSRRPRACMETPRARTGRPKSRPPCGRMGGGSGGEGHAP